MKKILSFLFIFAFLFSLNATAQVWDGTSSTWTKGEGTSSSPYLIESPQHLAYLSKKVAEGVTFEGKFFSITSNLDMGGSEGQKFQQIGKLNKFVDPNSNTPIDSSLYFKGTLDGKMHEIDNLNIEYINEELGGTGLFACTTTSSVIRNLTIGKNSIVKGGTVVGAFVGQMNGGLIENCCNKASVTATNFFLGGFVGVMEDGLVTKCVNRGAINGTTEVGGIVGQLAYNSSVTFCYNTALVTAVGFGGAGICGAMYDISSIKNSFNAGKIDGQSSPWMGAPHAIVADAGTCKVVNCYYEKSLSGVDDEHAVAKTKKEMGLQSFVDALNAGEESSPFVIDSKNVNNGLPLLKWETEGDQTGIHDAIADKINLRLSGNEVSSDSLVTVFDMSGRLVASGNKLILEQGVYIIKCAGKSIKYIVK